MNSSNSTLTSFIQKYQSQVSPKIDNQRIVARILTCNDEGLKTAGEIIRSGELVAFPTETVYGLAANAFDDKAVRKIFQTKRRPLSDPVIVHVTSAEQALAFVDINEKVKELFIYLSGKFWPGPFTCVLKADLSKIPEVVTANTGYVGVRYPKNKVAQDFINASQRPIAAPSANLFSHVSPTSPVHVFNDFYDQNVAIIDGETSEFGIESTVVKILEDGDGLKLLILRVGSLSEKSIKEALSQSEKFKNIEVSKFKKESYVHENVNSEAPGMLLKHYSPYLETYLLDITSETSATTTETTEMSIDKSTTVLIDFSSHLKTKAKDYLKYYSLSDSGDVKEAMSNLYDVLRSAENVEGAKTILILNLSRYYEEYHKEIDELPEFLESVYDKSFRSASGKKINYNFSEDKLFL